MVFPTLRFPKGEFVRNLSLLITSNLIVRLISLAAYPLLVRMYSPYEFGLLAAFTTLVTIPATVASLRYELAIPIPRGNRSAAMILLISVIWISIISAGAALAIPLLGHRMLSGMNAEGLGRGIWFVPIAIYGYGLYQATTYWAIRERNFKLQASTLVSKTATESAFQLLGGVFRIGGFGLVIGNLIGNIAGNWKLGRLAWSGVARYWKLAKWGNIVWTSRRYVKFPLYSGSSGLINILAGRVPYIFITSMFGIKALGVFSLACLVLDAPASLITNAVNRVYYPEAVLLYREDPVRLKRLYKKCAYAMLAILLVPIVMGYIISPWVLTHILGKAWEETGLIVRVLIVGYYFKMIANPLSNFSILEKQGYGLVWNLIFLAVNIVAFVIAKSMGLSFRDTTVIYSIAMVLGYALMLVMCYRVILVKINNAVEPVTG